MLARKMIIMCIINEADIHARILSTLSSLTLHISPVSHLLPVTPFWCVARPRNSVHKLKQNSMRNAKSQFEMIYMNYVWLFISATQHIRWHFESACCMPSAAERYRTDKWHTCRVCMCRVRVYEYMDTYTNMKNVPRVLSAHPKTFPAI